MNIPCPVKSGATHFHPGNDEWRPTHIKVVDDPSNKETGQKVYVWLSFKEDYGEWSDVPVYDKDPGNYVKLDVASKK